MREFVWKYGLTIGYLTCVLSAFVVLWRLA